MQDCDKLIQIFSCDQPEVHDIVQKMRATVDEYEDRVMIGEIYLPIHKIVTNYGEGNKGRICLQTFSGCLLIGEPMK